MAQLSVAQYDRLEKAIQNGTRIAIRVQYHEYVVMPERIDFEGSRERLVTRHPTTGDRLFFHLDTIESLEDVK